jgi:hypothetical protein
MSFVKYQRAEKVEAVSEEEQKKLNQLEKSARTLDNLDKNKTDK